jgi:hypothetical protein
MFGPKREDATEKWRKLYDGNLYSSPCDDLGGKPQKPQENRSPAENKVWQLPDLSA